MTPRKYFDRFMVDNEVGRNLKLMRLTDAEFRAFLCGVLPIASKADTRGAFMVGAAPATAEDVAHQSLKTSAKVAESCLRKLREMRMLEFDDALGGEWVHDFDEYNPTPKQDPTNAKRQAEWRARNAANNGGRNAKRDGGSGSHNEAVTPPEVRSTEDPPTPQGGSVVTFGRKAVPKARLALAESLLAYFNERAGTNYGPFTGTGKPSDVLKRIIGCLTENPNLDEAEARRVIDWRLANPYWQGAAQVGVVFGPGAIAGNRASAMQATAPTDLSAWTGAA